MSEETNGVAVVDPPKIELLKPQPRQALVVQDSGINAELLDTARFDQCYRIAKIMSQSYLTPDHLRKGTAEEAAANCFQLVMQAFRWNMDPFAIMGETYFIKGKMAYQGKLVMAVINTSPLIAERLSFSFTGAKETLAVTVSGKLKTETEPRTVEVSWLKAKTSNDMWIKDPEQKLCYSGGIKWARRHAPEIILGVRTDDDLDRMVIEPAESKPLLAQSMLTATLRGKVGCHNSEDMLAVCNWAVGDEEFDALPTSDEDCKRVLSQLESFTTTMKGQWSEILNLATH